MRPTLPDMHAYRAAADTAALRFVDAADLAARTAAAPLLELGLQHEQPHQELLLVDALHL